MGPHRIPAPREPPIGLPPHAATGTSRVETQVAGRGTVFLIRGPGTGAPLVKGAALGDDAVTWRRGWMLGKGRGNQQCPGAAVGLPVDSCLGNGS